MTRRRSTSSSHVPSKNISHSTDSNGKSFQTTSDLYKQAYQSLMNQEGDQGFNQQCDHPSNPVRHMVPPPHLNNLRPVDSTLSSPLRRPRSPSDNGSSDLDDFIQDPRTKTIINNRKKTKLVNGNTNNNPNKSPIIPQHPAQQQQRAPLVAPSVLSSTREPTSSSLTTAPSHDRGAIIAPACKVLTDEAKVFAQSRYPFAPFSLRFSSPNIQEKKIVDDLCRFIKEKTKKELELCGYRKSSAKCAASDCDLLLFAKTSQSFALLLDDSSWPQSILGLNFSRPSTPSLPPQFSVMMKNVDISIDFDNFTSEVKSFYSNVRNVIRMKNGNQSIIKLVKLEFIDHVQRDEILTRGKIFVNFLSYNVEEYLAPAWVLICSKCMGIGHFRKQCKRNQDTCKKCGLEVDDISSHNTTCSKLRCVHCGGNHMSNDMKCPIVKQFRADLSRFLLSPAIQANPHVNNDALTASAFPPLNPTQSQFGFNRQQNTVWGNNARPTNNFVRFDNVHPPPPSSPYHQPLNSDKSNAIVNKIEDLINGLKQVNATLEKIVNKNEQFDQFIKEKTASDEALSNKIDNLIANNSEGELIATQHEIKLARHENLLMKLVLPILDEITRFTSNLNAEKNPEL